MLLQGTSMRNKETTVIPANAQNRYEVTAQELPLSCPMPGMALWNAHPKVFLPIEETGQAKCPYCGAEYVLTDWSAHGHHH
ncbi:MAG: zinc-finger domain-containing protein [Proteobacteria bacterium]|nr:zinc-finger domain-containing protein [Pseudomonadota bacterium]